jgi:hypothetical protein
MVEHSAVNRRVASSNLARGANFSFFFNQLQTAIFTSSVLGGCLSRKCNAARFPYSRLFALSTAFRTSAIEFTITEKQLEIVEIRTVTLDGVFRKPARLSVLTQSSNH